MMRRECSVHHCPHAPGCGGKAIRRRLQAGTRTCLQRFRGRGRVKRRFSVSLLHGRVSQLTQTQRRAAHLEPFELKMSVKRGAQVQTTSVRAEACRARACARGCFPHVDKRARASSLRHVCGPHSERLTTPATIFLPLLHLHQFTEATLTSSAGIYMYICMYRFTG